MKKFLMAVFGYGRPPHPAIHQGSDGRWYRTECQQLRA